MSRALFAALLCIIPLTGFATQKQPWFGKDKLLESRLGYTYRRFPRIKRDSQSEHYSSNGCFLHSGLSISPVPAWSAEAEIVAAETRHRRMGFDHFRFTGRYLILDDVLGDPISLTTGLSLGRASHKALDDISSFHHGLTEAEFHVAMGKETSCEEFWVSHYWSAISVGSGDRGAPWIDAIVAYEQNAWDRHRFKLFIQGLWGLGHHTLPSPDDFSGYGHIAHRSLDVGGSYSFLVEGGTLSAKYAYRPWARNFPSQAHTVSLSLMIPIGF